VYVSALFGLNFSDSRNAFLAFESSPVCVKIFPKAFKILESTILRFVAELRISSALSVSPFCAVRNANFDMANESFGAISSPLVNSSSAFSML
jgi:hypothetical protein